MAHAPATAPTRPCFASADQHADVAVIIVTYNSADDIDRMLESVRSEAGDLALRVVLADNGSTDATLDIVRAGHGDVLEAPTPGNVGYAAAINIAMRQAGDADHLLVLNPDLRVEPGAIRRLIQRLASDESLGAAVPRIVDESGETYHSIRREPTILRAAGDAFIGRLWVRRPPILSEYVRVDQAYELPQRIDWATGAAVMIRRRAALESGEWDERFFLYSEETDFFRRLRAAGWAVAYEPGAIVMHRGGGSGQSADLAALMAVSRVRYYEKHHPATAALYRALVMIGEELRRGDSTHDAARRALRRRARWSHLPHATFDDPSVDEFPRAAVIVPAHNESAVIARTLAPLAPLAEAGRIELIIACNGCIDDTAAIAGGFPGVRVLDLPVASKSAALNAGDSAATCWPRVYLDADIAIQPAALAATIHALESDGVLAARPAARVRTEGSDWRVRAYYRARGRMPSMSRALWGGGVYALSREGRAMFGDFPSITADDLFVDTLIPSACKTIVATEPVVVQAPLRAGDLMSILTRARRGSAEQGVDTSATSARDLLRTIRGPASALDAVLYGAFAAVARIRGNRAGAGAAGWERDDSSRSAWTGDAARR